jgi:tRNA G18 (ribose-2'-O)-methylase SpoU
MDPLHDISLYTNIRDRDLKNKGLLVAEGRPLAVRLLASGLEVISILCSERMADEFRELARGRCPLHILDNEGMERVAGFPFHRGVMAVAVRPATRPLDLFLSESAACRNLVLCPRLSGDENLGGIIRTSDALGADCLAIGTQSCDPFSRRALKVSMGAALSLPIVTIGGVENDFALLKKHGFTVYGASTGENSIPLHEVRPAEKRAVVFGNESEGIPENIASLCDAIVHVPMHNNTDSLNVGVAAGIILYALFRQKTRPVS